MHEIKIEGFKLSVLTPT